MMSKEELAELIIKFHERRTAELMMSRLQGKEKNPYRMVDMLDAHTSKFDLYDGKE